MNMSLSAIAAIYGGIGVLITIGLTFGSARIGRLKAAAWMVTVAAVLLLGEDPWQLIYMASSGSTADPDGVRGVVDPHTLGHMYGGAAWAVAAFVLTVWIAHLALVPGERWAWTALLVALLVGGAGDFYEITVYPHGLPLLPTPPDGIRGFGWPTLVAGLAIWVFALAFAYRAVFRPRTEDGQSREPRGAN
jgi:hypothetical protein